MNNHRVSSGTAPGAARAAALPDLQAVKQGQQAAWASGDFGRQGQAWSSWPSRSRKRSCSNERASSSRAAWVIEIIADSSL